MRTIVAGLLFVLLMPTVQSEEPPPLKLTVKADRQRYDSDDTIMILAEFGNAPGTKLQLDDDGGGALYFHVVLEPIGRKGTVTCEPLWKLQFAEWAEKRDGSSHRLKEIEEDYTHQLAVHLPRLKGLPEGQYKARVGYTRRQPGQLEALIEAATGQKPWVERMKVVILDGGWDGALLSEPITITIGPAQEKKK